MRASEITLEPQDSLALLYQVVPERWSALAPSFTSSNTSVAVVTNDKVTAVADGSTTITGSVRLHGNTSEDTASVDVVGLSYNLTSARAATGIVIARSTAEIEVGEDYSCQAYVLSAVTEDHPYSYGYPDDNLVLWESSAPSVCRVKNGVLTGVATGTATITAYNLTKTVSQSFLVNVVAASELAYTSQEVLTLQESDVTTTDTETTTTSIQTILADAHDDGYKKVVFPANQEYTVSPVYGSIVIPTQMIVDFNGSIIQIEESAMTQTGYAMFQIGDCEQSEIRNVTIYGERTVMSGTGSSACRSVRISGASVRAGLRNCTISYSPGFNVSFGNTNMQRAGLRLSSIEPGGIDDQGQDVALDYSYRGNTYISLASIGDKFGLGNMQGYGGYVYMSARMYDIFFYDSNHTFLSCLKNCVQYYRYPKPANAAYCRITYRYGSAPTSGDPDFNSIAHVYSMDMPERCFLKNCRLEENYSTAITPNGGDSTLIDSCYFKNNGYRDPASHIDWEDGRQNNKGHILRDCYFEGGGSVTLIGADGTAIHNNIFKNCSLRNGSEVQNSRIWLNQFLGNKTATITTKTDMVFSQNHGFDNAAYTITNVEDVGFAVRETDNEFS